jgi:hypothetical protein
MSDRNPDEADEGEGRSSRFQEIAARLDDEADAGEEESSQFGEMAGRLDDEADEGGADAGTASGADRAERMGSTSERRDRSATEDRSEGSQRAHPDGDAGDEAEPDDSWEWIDAGDEDQTADTSGTDGRADSTDTDRGSEATGADPATAGGAERASRTDSETDPTADTETRDAASASDSSESTASGRRERKGRIWDSESEPTETAVESSPDAGSPTDSAASSSAEDFADTSTEPAANTLLDGVDLTPGTAVLVESGSQDDRTETTCRRLLHDDHDRQEPAVLLVRYQQMDAEELRQIATEAARTKLVSVGYTQDVPASLSDAIETVSINNPNDITRLGIVVSGTIDTWSDADERISVCYDSINVLLNYRDVKRAFRFLHVLLRTLRRGDAVSHFHVDPLAGEPQSINTLKPLFDEVVSIDSMGVTVE